MGFSSYRTLTIVVTERKTRCVGHNKFHRKKWGLCRWFLQLGEGRGVLVVGLDSALDDTRDGDTLDSHCLRRVYGITTGILKIVDTNTVINAHGVGRRGGPVLGH